MKESRPEVFSNENRVNIPVYPLDVFVLTDAGSAELQGTPTRLPPEALRLLVMLDGQATVGTLEQKLPDLKPERLRELIRSLLAARLVRAPTLAESEGLDFSEFFNAVKADDEASPGTVRSAEREASEGTPQLERTGYYVSIARQPVQARLVPGAKPVVLVADDDADVCALLSRLLRAEGFTVDTVEGGLQIVERLRQPPLPDLIVLDVNLGGVNGFDVLHKLKAHPKLREVPVVMLTVEAEREAVARGLQGGADGYITKPFEPKTLLAGVKAVLGL